MYKVGQSNDIHLLKRNILKKKSMIIGGTTIDSKYRIKSHSDGDVILHSIAEAIYGALGIGDLGTHFSDQDKKNKNICSREILNHALDKMDKIGYEIVNIDFTIICQKVYFARYRDKILTILMKLLKTRYVNFKATKWEDPSNRKIQVNTIVLLKPKNTKITPLEKSRLIEFINITNDSFTKKVIVDTAKTEVELKNKTITKDITEFINNFDDGDGNKYYDKNGYFKKIKRIRE